MNGLWLQSGNKQLIDTTSKTSITKHLKSNRVY